MDIEATFSKQTGGVFATPAADIATRLQKSVHAFLFDWDGVFNNGFKQGETGSSFSEIDSMGTNLLRFGYWLAHNRLPFFGIVTGEGNPSALHLAEREHYDAIYFKTRNKLAALEHLQNHFKLRPEQIAYGFDDVLDLPIARACGVRFVVTNQASPMFSQYLQDQQLGDYLTGQSGDTHGVREICELVLALTGQYEQAVSLRSTFDERYTKYLKLRNSGVTKQFYYSEDSREILQADPT